MKKKFNRVLKLGLFCIGLGLFNKAHTQQNQVLSTRIITSTDDAEERGLNASSDPGRMDLTSSDLELVRDGGDGDQFVGMRFTNITIPKNAIIDSVFIQFTVDETNNGATSVTIKAEDVDNSSTFVGINNNISSRATTVDSVNWNNIPAWNTTRLATIDQRTPDLKVLVKSIIGRAGWASGNPITFIITGTGERTAESFDGSANEAPELIIHYSVPQIKTFAVLTGDDDAEEDISNGAMDLTSSDLEFTTDGSSLQIVGIRFQNVSIPRGSIIRNAYIQFEVDEVTTTDTVNVAWGVELIDHAPAFTALPANLSGRTYSAVPTFWNRIPAWGTRQIGGIDQQTPDFSSLVQSIVNRSGWISGNAMVFAGLDPAVLSVPGYTPNAGKRTAESYNGSTSGAPRLVVEYLAPASYEEGFFPVAKLSSWKYNDLGIDLSATNWTSLAFNDSTWSFGNAILGYNNNNETTTLDFGSDPQNKRITTYLRHTFNVANAAQYDSLIFDVLRDDGVVVYVNGQEVFRQNMPSGTIGYNTLAPIAVGGTDETTFFRTTVNNVLVNGRNVIAVELHQNAATSSDLSFDMEVIGKLPPMATSSFPISTGDEWNYLDNGSDILSSNWKTLNYNDTAWAYGASPLGYGDPSATTLSFGNDPQNKHVTYYFRKRFNVANLTALKDTLQLSVRRDDGAIVHINGVEVFRTNMPAGPVNFRTTSSTIVSGADEQAFFSTDFPKSVLNQGINVIAIQLHQRDSLSSDLMIDVRLDEKPDPPVARRACLGPNDTHISCYTSLLPSAQNPELLIPETHNFQVLLKQGDAYMNQNVRNTAPGNNDFTGYVARNGSSVDGFLGVNHENTPGGVSLLDIRYIDSVRLWTVDSTQAVDFYNNDLVSTARNCSGGITPWGTIITSEETFNSGDANNDGYQDVGWQVEIDPITRKVLEYGTPGKQEKLWSLGRMSHENIAVANDSLTAYETEDAGSGCFYKFIADNKMDLSTGKLYALQLDGGLSSGEPVLPSGKWIQIPNATQADRNNTRNLALSLGATPFRGPEDVEIGTIDGKIYFTSKGNNRTYRFSDDNDSTISQFETFVGGMNYLINHGNGVTSEAWGSGNDNLAFDDLGNLYVLQDGSRNHIWMVAPNHTQANPKVDLFAKLPSGSEPCGMTFTPDYKFMFVSVQHPSGSNSSIMQTDAAGDPAGMNVSTTVVIARKEFLGNYAPTMAASNFTFPTSACDTVDLNFSKGNGDGRLVIAKEDAMVDALPMDGFTYLADNTLGIGSLLGANNFVIYDGTDSSVTIKGLKQNTMYHVSVFEYNQNPNKFYNTTVPAIDSTTTTAVTTSSITGSTNTFVNTTENYSVTSTSGSTYLWTVTNGTITSGAGTNSITVNWGSTIGLGTVSVIETNARGCEGDSVNQSVNIGTTGIQNFDLAHAMTIAPNPSNGRTTVSLIGTNDAYDVEVFDLVGKQIHTATNQTGTYEIDLTSEKKGTYVIRVRSQNKVGTKLYIKN